MFFFAKKHSTNKPKSDSSTAQKTSNTNIENIPSTVEIRSSNNEVNRTINGISESSNGTSQDQYLWGSSILFSKLKNQSSSPDLLFENEDWAPENEIVGLFRKRRATAEEIITPASDTQ